MPIVVQSKGKKHCKDIQKAAWDMYRLAPGTLKKPWEYYLKQAIEDHRRLVEDQMKMERQATEDHECL